MELLNFYANIKLSPNGCMLWQGSLDKDGYGRRWGKPQLVHRFSYLINKGDLDPALTIDHLCSVRNCVNPKHLEQISASENRSRSKLGNSKKTHCPKKHAYNEVNTRINPSGARVCRKCSQLAVLKYRTRTRD